ncbi:MAG: hypothetical protein PUB21_04345 [Bacteroidales bacterium]|nr:hypothetical protein [Bacteroidales bacterium]
MFRKIATLHIFIAVIMLIAMMILPHHHHHEFLIIAHYDCAQAAEHDAEHHEKDNCDVVRFISSIIRDDVNDNLQTSLLSAHWTLDYFTAELFTLRYLSAPEPMKPDKKTISPFAVPLFSAYITKVQALRAPPVI